MEVYFTPTLILKGQEKKVARYTLAVAAHEKVNASHLKRNAYRYATPMSGVLGARCVSQQCAAQKRR